MSFLLGGLGIHRLMMGYSNWWLMLITLGGCGIWTLIDLIKIIFRIKEAAQLEQSFFFVWIFCCFSLHQNESSDQCNSFIYEHPR